jgi:hypothetical protein
MLAIVLVVTIVQVGIDSHVDRKGTKFSVSKFSE